MNQLIYLFYLKNAPKTKTICTYQTRMTFKGDTCNDGNKSKDRLTILFCCNSDGSEKLKPLVIGKSKNQRFF
jgi:hypothetical protein